MIDESKSEFSLQTASKNLKNPRFLALPFFNTDDMSRLLIAVALFVCLAVSQAADLRRLTEDRAAARGGRQPEGPSGQGPAGSVPNQGGNKPVSKDQETASSFYGVGFYGPGYGGFGYGPWGGGWGGYGGFGGYGFGYPGYFW